MTRILLSILFFIASLFLQTTRSLAQYVIDDPALMAAKADTLLNQSIELGEHAGLSAGIYGNGKILWSAGAGMLDLKEKAPANAHMINRIASISKPMTAVAILQLYEQGKLDLDEPVRTYVPEFPQKPEGDFTTRQLLIHTSGIAHYKSDKDGAVFKEYPTLLSAMGRFKDRDLIAKPGERHQYTTYGYVVLGVIIEKISGMSYEAYMKKYIWEPAGMKNTSVEKKGQVVENKSSLYKITDKGKLKDDFKTNISAKVPGGGIQSTAEDLLLFGKAILENTLIKEETRDLMITDSEMKKRGNPYAMGWFLYAKEDSLRGRIIGHSGAQAGTSTQLMILLDKGIVVSTISNTRRQWNQLFRMNEKLIELAALEKERAKPVQKVVALSPLEMDRMIGKYDFGKDQLMTISRKGNQLYSQMNKNPELKLYPSAKNKVNYRIFNGSFDFDFDERGQVVKATYWQNGKEVQVTKVE